MRTLKYQLTVEEHVEANRFITGHSPSIRRRRLIVTSLGAIVYFFVGTWIGKRISADPWFYVGFGVFFATVTIVPLVWFRQWLSARTIRKMLSESSNRAALGVREVSIDEEKMSVKGETGESSVRWIGIERVTETRRHAFFYISSIHAHMLPKVSVFSGNPKEFVEAAKEYWLAANPGKVVEEYQ